MASITVAIGIILTILGAAAYGAFPTPPHPPHITALIPAVLGILILLMGIMSRQEKMRKHATHGALGLALLGLVGSLGGLKYWPKMMTSGALEPWQAKAGGEMLLMFFICGVYLVVGGNSFVRARKAKAAE